MQVSAIYCFLGALIYATYPLIMGLALQGERYALLQALMLSVIYLGIRAEGKEAPRKHIFLGAIFLALSLCQHLISVFVAIFWILPAIYLYRIGKIQSKDLWRSLMLFSLILFICYFSLPLLRTGGPLWPDWGKLSNLSDLYHHFIRRDLGFFELHLASGVRNYFNGLQFLLKNMQENFLYLILFPLAGVLFIRRKNKIISWSFILTLFLIVAALFFLKNFNSNNSFGFFERYLTLFYVFAFILLGPGIEFIGESIKTNHRTLFRAFVATIILIWAIHLFNNMSYFRGFGNNLVPLYRKYISLSLGEGDVYVSGSDFETFYGVGQDQRVRFPIVNLIQYPWYQKEVLPYVDPELSQYRGEIRNSNFDSFTSLLYYIHLKGFIIVSSSRAVLMPMYLKIQRRGLLFEVGKAANRTQEIQGTRDKKLEFNLQLASLVCSDLKMQEINISERGHYFMKEILIQFANLFRDISQEEKYPESIKDNAKLLAGILKPGGDTDEWFKACVQYQKSL